ncbi:MAG TPA: filamentous hemagglutinin N-terminal domain-containing protein, partial [Allocoleopsis sp.]
MPATDGTQTVVTPIGTRFDITGGRTSKDGINLFHSFSQFNLEPNQVANFIANPAIQNILTRVTSGSASVINGLIQVIGGNANLFLMNPAGIVFGANARLNVPASFTATTATGIGLGNLWFNATGPNNYAELVGTPSAFAFASQAPGAIANSGQLIVSKGNNLTLLGGTVVSTGYLEAAGGSVLVETVVGGSLLRISQPGHLLSIEIPASQSAIASSSLPELLTNGVQTKDSLASSAVQAGLASAGVPVEQGDIVVKTVVAQTTTLSAQNDLSLIDSQLRTTGDLNLLAQNTVIVRDSATNSFLAQAGGNLYIQGDRKIDIFALNSPQTPFQSGGNFSLVSDGIISLDAHASSSGGTSILTLSGKPGNFKSLNDPIITAGTNVLFGNYTGAALKVEAGGSITYGDITITRPADANTIPTSDPNFGVLTNTPAVIMNAGTTITTGNINTSSQGNAGPVVLSAQGNITTGNITSSSRTQGNAGAVTLLTAQGNITTGNIVTQAQGDGNSGAISVSSGGNISTGEIDSTSLGQGNAGAVTMSSKGTMTIGNITTQDQGDGSSGAVLLSAGGNLTANNISTQDLGDGNAAAVSLSSGGNLTVSNIDTSEQGPGNSGAVSLSAVGSITNGLINQLQQGPGEQAGLPTITPYLGGILKPPSSSSPNTSPNGTGTMNPPSDSTTNSSNNSSSSLPSGGSSSSNGSSSSLPSGDTTNSSNSSTTNPSSSSSSSSHSSNSLPSGDTTNSSNNSTTNPSSSSSSSSHSSNSLPSGGTTNVSNSSTTNSPSGGSSSSN